MSKSSKYSNMQFSKDNKFTKRHDLRKQYKDEVDKRRGKNMELKIDLFGDYEHATWGTLTELGNILFIDIYSRVLKDTYLTYIVDYNFQKNLMIAAKLITQDGKLK